MADASPGAPLLLVGAGKMGLGYISAATRLGVPVRLAEYAALADRSRPLVERVVAVDSMLEESWYAGALAALEAERPGGVVAYAEPHVLAAALLADAYLARACMPPSYHATRRCSGRCSAGLESRSRNTGSGTGWRTRRCGRQKDSPWW
jgi:hypothetical protein